MSNDNILINCSSSDNKLILIRLKPHLPQVNLDPNTGIFVTMNPAGKGYGGRQKLPDNLKQLFRPVAMTKPDNELIAEVLSAEHRCRHFFLKQTVLNCFKVIIMMYND